MRVIKEIIIHCTATDARKPLTVAAIDRYHRSLGWTGIGYHYVIHQDGTVEQGRDEDLPGAHCHGHNKHSIGIAYVGGLNANGKAEDTRTQAQKDALTLLIIELISVYGRIEIHGHNEYAAKKCPCFNVQDEYKDMQ